MKKAIFTIGVLLVATLSLIAQNNDDAYYYSDDKFG